MWELPKTLRLWHPRWWRQWFWHIYGLTRRGELPRLWWCPYCKRFRVLYYVYSMTNYETKPGEPDQNEVGHYCHDCREAYEEYWSDMWNEYYRGCM
jgi:uncharacterized protein YbaR (Trm112 family)